MPHGEQVILALGRVREAADAPRVAQLIEARLAAGDDLVGVALVAYVPQQLVLLEIEDVVQRKRQLHRAEVARQVSAGLAHRAENELPNLLGQPCKLGHLQILQVRRAVDLL